MALLITFFFLSEQTKSLWEDLLVTDLCNRDDSTEEVYADLFVYINQQELFTGVNATIFTVWK